MAKTTLYQFTMQDETATFTFPGHAARTISLGTLSGDMQISLMVHGLKQKVADGAAMSRNPETGRPASDSDKIDRMNAIIDRLIAGQWRATGEGGATATGGYLLRALCELYPTRSVEQLREFVAGKSETEKIKLRASSKIAPIIERLKAEKARPSVEDEADLFAGLDDEEQPDD